MEQEEIRHFVGLFFRELMKENVEKLLNILSKKIYASKMFF
jgi:hypothetical protein